MYQRISKKALSLLLTLAMLCSLLCTTAFAAELDAEVVDESLEAIVEVVEDEIAEEAEEPAEIPEAPVEDEETPTDEGTTVTIPESGIITTAAQLALMTNGDYTLGADITINAASWVPVANFTGTFDGDDYTITWSGTATLSANNFAIFATNSGTIEDLYVDGTLTLANGGSTSRDYVAAVVGTNSGVINNVESSAVINASNTYNVGGIAGLNTGYILNSSNSGAVSGYARVGGIVGANNGTVNSCSNSAQVYMNYNGKGGVGGIAGFNGDKNGSVEAHIWNCYNTGYILSGDPDVSSTQGSWVGGICGFVNVKSDCVNCYNTGDVSGYAFLDHISGRTEGTNTNCYGLSTAEGPEGYDDAEELTATAMTSTSFVTMLDVGTPNPGRWMQTAGSYPTLRNNATEDDEDPANANPFNIVVYSGPTKLTYNANETLSLAGLDIRAVYTNGTYVTITNYTSSIAEGTVLTESTTLTISGTYEGVSYSFTFDITVNSGTTTTTVYLDGNAATNGDGTANSPYNNLADAVIGAGDGGIVFVTNTVTLPDGQQNGNVTVKRGSNLTGPLFKVTSGTVTLTSMTIDGLDSGTLIEVTGGTLRLRGGVTLTDCAVAVDVQAGGAVTVNKATISGTDYSIQVAGTTETSTTVGAFTLEDFGGTSISGTVKLGNGVVITVGAAIPCNLTVECAAPVDGLTIAAGTYDSATETGYALTDTDAGKVSCTKSNAYNVVRNATDDQLELDERDIYLDVVNGSDDNTGLSASAAVKTYAKAVELAGNGGFVAVKNTVTIAASGTQSYFDNVTFKRAEGFTGALFEVTSGTVRLAGSSMVLDGMGTGTLVKVTGGTLQLRGGVTLKNCDIAVDVLAGGALAVNKASISVATTTTTTTRYSIKVADDTSTFTLDNYGGTSISGTVYLGDGAYISVLSTLTSLDDGETITVSCAGAEAERIIALAEGSSFNAFTAADAAKVVYQGTNYSVVVSSDFPDTLILANS